ncbi:MAG TPA: hypothetical protein VFU03_06995, partial [Gemmatimonadales bacterium]|nr:hypothetical protein [Gemmatimonadales bacterium]
MRALHGALTITLVMLAACGKKQEAAQPPAADTAGNMGGMKMSAQGMQMMPLMRAHLDSLGAMQPAQMAAAMAAHQDLASRMMDAMGADMRGMNMKPDSAWAALSDSLRQDLADLPALSDGPLKNRMQAHIGRMQRMMA